MTQSALVVSLLALSCGRGAAPAEPPKLDRTSSAAPTALANASQGAAVGDEASRSAAATADATPARGATVMQVHAAVSLGETSEQRVSAPRRCPSEMAFIERPSGAYCIDRWEDSLDRRLSSGGFEPWPSNEVVDGREAELVAVSVAGRKPQGYVSGVQAQRACNQAQKRLCQIDEWVRACRGPEAQTYPYGNTRRPGVCNDRSKVVGAHPVVALFEQFAPPGASRAKMWTPEWMNDPRLFEMPHSVEPAGANPECKSAYGVYDLVGNLHEWTADPDGTFVGGFFMDTTLNGEGCGYRTRAHNFEYHDYSTGFRCCKDADSE